MAIHDTLNVHICENASDATQQGHFYRQPIYKSIAIEKVVVVKNGTVAGNPTVDFVLVDETGQKFVFMVTGALLKSIPC